MNLDLLQASLSFKFEIVRKMRKLKNKEKKKRKRGEGESSKFSPSPLFLFFFSLFFSFRIFRTISNLKEREACSKSMMNRSPTTKSSTETRIFFISTRL